MKIRIFNEVRDPEMERVAQPSHLLTEAVENIIPPSMSLIIRNIQLHVDGKPDQDMCAKYVAAFFPVHDGTGKHFNVEFIGRMFYNESYIDMFYNASLYSCFYTERLQGNEIPI